jgi:hypothetical protein
METPVYVKLTGNQEASIILALLKLIAMGLVKDENE